MQGHSETHAVTINFILHHQRQTLLRSPDISCCASLLVCLLPRKRRHKQMHRHTVHIHTQALDVWMHNASRSTSSLQSLAFSFPNGSFTYTATILCSHGAFQSQCQEAPFIGKSSNSILLRTDLILFSKNGEVLQRSKALKMKSSVKSFSLIFPMYLFLKAHVTLQST